MPSSPQPSGSPCSARISDASLLAAGSDVSPSSTRVSDASSLTAGSDISPPSTRVSDASSLLANTSPLPYTTNPNSKPPSSTTTTANAMSSNENATSGDDLGNARSKPSPSAIVTMDAISDDNVGNAKSKPSSSTTTTETTPLPHYRLLRPLYNRVLSMKAPEDVVKRALQIYDLQEDEHPEEVVNEVEEMLGLKEIEWPAESVRLELIEGNLEASIMHVLRSYGYREFGHTGRNGKAILTIAPPAGEEALPLPEWLRIPFIVPTDPLPPILRRDSCSNPWTRSGDALLDQSQRSVGTLGVIMSSPRVGRAPAEVVITAGHVIPDGDGILLVENRKHTSFISLGVAPRFRRFNNRPLHRQKKLPSFRDDVGILFIESDDLKFFSRFIANLNVHYFDQVSRHKLATAEMADPCSRSRRKAIRRQLKIAPITVYKVGSASDLTIGRFEKIIDSPPNGWYEPKGDEWSLEDQDKDYNEWMGVVRWMNVPFTASGDSGSLVFAREDGIHIPLGIHVGSPDGTQTSLFVSLETFCFEAEVEGLELYFRH